MTRLRYLPGSVLPRGSIMQAWLCLALLLSSQLAAGLPAWAQDAAARKDAAKKLSERHWHSQLHRLQGLVLDNRRLGDFLGPIMRHEYTLPMSQIQKSLVYMGSNYRLRRVVHDLILGRRPIKVGAIGGSITHGAKASVIGETDWFSLVGKYLKAAFPRATISTRNGALPATPSALMNMCLEQYVDDDVDLVFVEYVANDGANRFDEIKAKVYERLLRKLLLRPSRPAVVLLQLMPKGMAFAPGSREKVPFYATLEDIYGAQAQYYDLPWLSYRNAMWRLTELHTYGYNWTDFMWDVDFMHPIDSGMAAISDMVAHLIQQTALGLLLTPLGRADRELMQEPLPQPMFAGNWQAKNLMCTYGEAFKPLADVNNSKGWDFINEGKLGSPKWGYISRTPGSTLKIVVNSMRNQDGKQQDGDAPQDSKNQPMNVMLAYLKSYDSMGMAKFECTSGCTCEAKPEVDALHSLHQSTVYLVRLLVSQAPKCQITITVLDRTRSEQHKFKVSICCVCMWVCWEQGVVPPAAVLVSCTAQSIE
eukprot:GHRR01016827.1.p1 GENE.GHRR01016827.1~~GHRR01016827.1.p1  ORF type:complete len:534 (+),score=145.77 GHRR01016827.1:354-1955(+)